MTKPPCERGETLIEVLIAMAVMGIAVAALLGGLTSGIFSSSLHREETVAGTVLESVGEDVVNNSVNPYVNCAITSSYNPEANLSSGEVPNGWKVVISGVEWWDGYTSGFVTASSVPCPDNTEGFLQMQLVSISVTSPDGQTSQTRAFMKRTP